MIAKKPGESYRPLVTIAKVKNGIPTVITVSGRRYVYEPVDKYVGGRKKQ